MITFLIVAFALACVGCCGIGLGFLLGRRSGCDCCKLSQQGQECPEE